jgi:hypothetical protein
MLEGLNAKANYMFEQMKEINKITDAKCFEIEKEMSIAENIFQDALNGIIREINSQKQV